jgi:MFS family permease
VLLCQVYFALIMGAVTPLITPLAHEFGLGSGGIGLFFSAVGLGGLLGAPLAVVLARWLQTSVVLLLSGLLAPLGLLFIGVTDSHAGALAAILLTAMAGASLNVIVITVLQRLTPSKIQGCVFGVGQSLLGIAWVISLATISGVMAVWPEGVSVQPLLIVVGGIGFLLFLAGWYRYRRQIQPACESCVPRLKNLGALCRAICESPSRVSAGACRLICGAQIQCGY